MCFTRECGGSRCIVDLACSANPGNLKIRFIDRASRRRRRHHIILTVIAIVDFVVTHAECSCTRVLAVKHLCSTADTVLTLKTRHRGCTGRAHRCIVGLDIRYRCNRQSRRIDRAGSVFDIADAVVASHVNP